MSLVLSFIQFNSTEAEFMTVKFREVSGHNLENLRLEVSIYHGYITNQFQTTFAGGGGGIRK